MLFLYFKILPISLLLGESGSQLSGAVNLSKTVLVDLCNVSIVLPVRIILYIMRPGIYRFIYRFMGLYVRFIGNQPLFQFPKSLMSGNYFMCVGLILG